jgi:RimJ/RimL family protein N-acetyltransferase
MKLQALETAEHIELAASWLARKENYQWLDFGNGQQLVTPALLRVMTQRKNHVLYTYSPDDGDRPIGVVGLENFNDKFRTATLWGASGDKSFRSRGYGTAAAARFLTMAFDELGLHAINTWIVDGNPSQRMIERLNFRLCGRQRECHYIDGQAYDRLLYDLLAGEHKANAVYYACRRTGSKVARDRPAGARPAGDATGRSLA